MSGIGGNKFCDLILNHELRYGKHSKAYDNPSPSCQWTNLSKSPVVVTTAASLADWRWLNKSRSTQWGVQPDGGRTLELHWHGQTTSRANLHTQMIRVLLGYITQWNKCTSSRLRSSVSLRAILIELLFPKLLNGFSKKQREKRKKRVHFCR